eukprot:4584381-Prymnesium_polylepis.2
MPRAARISDRQPGCTTSLIERRAVAPSLNPRPLTVVAGSSSVKSLDGTPSALGRCAASHACAAAAIGGLVGRSSQARCRRSCLFPRYRSPVIVGSQLRRRERRK